MRADFDNASPTAIQPIGIEDAVELVPVGTPRAKQALQRRAQRAGSPGRIACQHARCILAFFEADGEGIAAQHLREVHQAAQREFAQTGRIDNLVLLAGHHATFPSSRAETSRVSRARSSWVFSRQRSVSCTVSGSSCRFLTPSPSKAAAQSSVSATPGTL